MLSYWILLYLIFCGCQNNNNGCNNRCTNRQTDSERKCDRPPLLNLRVTNEESRTVMITPLSSQDHLITVLLCRIPADVKTKVNKHVQSEAMETSESQTFS